MDLIVQVAAGPPGFDLELVVTCLQRHSNKAVAFDAVASPVIDTVYLQEQIGSLLIGQCIRRKNDSYILVHLAAFTGLCQKLKVERERKMADVLVVHMAFLIFDLLDDCLAYMCH